MSLRNEYLYCKEILELETRFSSSTTDLVGHRCYREVIGMGKAVVPYILKDFAAGNYLHWFSALKEITGVDPVSAEKCGKPKEMAEAWLAWGRGEGLI